MLLFKLLGAARPYLISHHDNFFRETWSNLSNARSSLENYLPKKILKHVRLDTLEICKDSFIDQDLQDYYSDMLYKVQLGNDTGFIYFLFEHKSYPDRLVQIQLLEYMVKIWRLQIKQSGKNRLPIVIPQILYHGKGKWRAAPDLISLFQGPTDELADYIPDFQYVLYDLSRYSDDQIKGTITARVAMLLLKHIFAPDIKDRLPGIFSLLKDLSVQETGLQYFESLLRYVLSNVEGISSGEMKSIVSKNLSGEKQGDVIMATLAEQFWNEGLEKGIQKGLGQGKIEGRIEGLRDAIELGMTLKFPEHIQEVMEQVENIVNLDTLTKIKEAIKKAGNVSPILSLVHGNH